MAADGGGACGALRYAVEGQPKAVVVCHCTHRQRQSGSAFGMSMTIGADQFDIARGAMQCFSKAGRFRQHHAMLFLPPLRNANL